jgi:formate hydrogenlyase subunit 3/multisubunit Na+/H+ antiporter MnhD subunit
MSSLPSGLALSLVPALPLAMLVLSAVPCLRERIGRWIPWAAVPALVLALWGEPGIAVQGEWMLLGCTLAMNTLNRVFLLFTSLLWLGAGLFVHDTTGEGGRGGLPIFWLATMTGNFWLLLAGDVPSFYSGFALMTFAAYGLIIHSRSPAALEAGRVYLSMAIIGEGLIVVGLLLAVNQTTTPLVAQLADLPALVAQSPHRDLTIACLLLGFGVKAGLPLLHLWLPLAHPVAPIAASAVLSGAMIKAGLIGWLQTLPLGLIALPHWGLGIIAAGFGAAWGGALIGIHQRTPKTVLAYSSISQMGLMTVGIGAGLYQPALWPALAPAISVYALHHGLAKGALFLGVGFVHQGRDRWRCLLWIGLALPGISLAGLMLSGATAKIGFKLALDGAVAPPAWWLMLPLLLGLAAVGTTALIARYLWLLHRCAPPPPASGRQWLGWAVVLGASLFTLTLLPWVPESSASPSGSLDLCSLLWPVLTGTVFALVAMRFLRAWPIPAGDLIVPITWLLHTLAERMHHFLKTNKKTGRHLWKNLPTPKLTTSSLQPETNSIEYGARRNVVLILVLLLAWGMVTTLIGFP